MKEAIKEVGLWLIWSHASMFIFVWLFDSIQAYIDVIEGSMLWVAVIGLQTLLGMLVTLNAMLILYLYVIVIHLLFTKS